MAKIENHWLSSSAHGYMSKIWICTHFSSVTCCTCHSYRTFLFLNRRQSTSQRRWRKQRRSWKKIHMTSTLGAYWFVKHRFSDTGLHSFLPGVTCFGRERGSLTAHLMLFHVNGLWDVPCDSVCKLILLLLDQPIDKARKTYERLVAQFPSSGRFWKLYIEAEVILYFN